MNLFSSTRSSFRFRGTVPSVEKMDVQLAAIPPEIIEHVAQNLQLAELCSLRLTCKALAEKLSYYFGHTYFTKISTNFSLASIQKLDDISRCTWAKHIRVFRLDWDEEAGHGLIWDRDASKSVLPDLPVVKQVRDVILRFANCRSIYIGAPYEYDYMFSPRIDAIGCSDLLGLGFILIAETSLPLETFHINFGSDAGKDRVKTSQIHLEQIMRPAFKKALSNLKELSLRLYIDNGKSDWAWNLVSQAVHLQKLDWTVSLFEPFYFEPISLSYIQELTFQSVPFSEKNLTELLLRCRQHLRSLTLSSIRLNGNWRGIFRYLREFDNLESISFHFLRISNGRYVPCGFSGLDDGVEVPGSSGRKLQLRTKVIGGSPGRKRVVGVDYSGPGTRNVIEMLVNAIDE